MIKVIVVTATIVAIGIGVAGTIAGLARIVQGRP